MKKLLFPEQISQWLGVIGNTNGMEVASLSNHSILRTCMTDLGWYQRKQKQPFSNSRWQLASFARELRGGHYFHPNIFYMNGAWRKCLHKFSTLAGCSTQIMEETKCCWWAQQQLIGISISLDFHHHVNTVIALVRPKDVMMYARGINHE